MKKYHKKVISIVKPYLRKETKVADIGCGDGEVLEHLRNQGMDITGYDVVQRHKDSVIQDFSKEVDIGPIYDIVIVSEVVEHVENPYQFARNVEKILKENGLFALSYPVMDNIIHKVWFLLKGKIRRLKKETNKTFTTKETIAKLFKNFKIIDKKVVKHKNIDTHRILLMKKR